MDEIGSTSEKDHLIRISNKKKIISPDLNVTFP